MNRYNRSYDTVRQRDRTEVEALVVVAPAGGALPEAWVEDVRTAVARPNAP